MSAVSKFIIFSVNCKKVKNGEIGFCACNPCTENQGDCDYNRQCQGDLKCFSCPSSLGFDSNMDCCQIAFVGMGPTETKNFRFSFFFIFSFFAEKWQKINFLHFLTIFCPFWPFLMIF